MTTIWPVSPPMSPRDEHSPSDGVPAPASWLVAPEKGGNPAAPSGTATLLRLRPNRQPHLRRLPPQGLGHRLRGLPTFVTARPVCTRPGNVFTAALLICDY